MPQPFTLHVELSTPEGFSEQIHDLFSCFASDFIDVLFRDHTARLFDGVLTPTPGTACDVMRLNLDLVMLDKNLRAALRAAGFELPDRDDGHTESSHGGVDSAMIGLEAGGVKPPASAIEARTKRLFGGRDA